MGPVIARRLARGAIVLVAWITATGAFGSCDFFKPAIPEPPTGEPIQTNYRTPLATLETIAKGIEAKRDGQDAYMGAFADSSAGNLADGRAFRAFFDARDLIGENWGDREWKRDLEQQLFQKLILLSADDYEMSWEYYEPGGNEEETATEALLHRKYRIVAVSQQGDRNTIAVGAADLRLVKSLRRPTDWVIVVWNDYHSNDADADSVTLGKRRQETVQ